MAAHTGSTPAECPACGPEHRTAVRLFNARPHRVYGRVTANGRRQAAASRRDGQAIFDRLFRAHLAAVSDRSR